MDVVGAVRYDEAVCAGCDDGTDFVVIFVEFFETSFIS